MAYALSLGAVTVLAGDRPEVKKECECAEAWAGCLPAFVFSVPGQVRFRTALYHLTTCNSRRCRTLRSRVFKGMGGKLTWLLNEEVVLGCVHIQPSLFGSSRVVMQRKDFPAVARHLAHCPRESCAQLRRALLLAIREELRAAQTQK